jgi:ribA/ribD-fused uncharacterized protein
LTATLPSHLREYQRKECAVFRKTRDSFGGLSNMAPGFPMQIDGIAIRTSESLYQACRFPYDPDLQRLVIEQRSPMTAKMITKPHRVHTRADWDSVRVGIMRWVLRVKLAQNWESFGELLRCTGGMPIVEDSYKDTFWGAKAVNSDRLVGQNILGRLLMELRQDLAKSDAEGLRTVQPLPIPDFLLLGTPIGVVRGTEREVPDSPSVVLEQAKLL